MQGIGRVLGSVAIAVGVPLAAGSAHAVEPYVTYDGFSASPLDPAKWGVGERVRQVRGKALAMVQRDWGSTASDSGSAAESFGEDFTVPGKVTQLRARVTANAVEVTGCPFNPAPSQARARLIATFFNTGNPIPGSYVGDVIAQVQLVRASNSVDAPGVLRAQGLLQLCTSSDCQSASTLGSVDLGTVAVGQTSEIRFEWLKSLKKVVYTRDAGAGTGEIAYTQSDLAAPGRPVVSVGNRTAVAACQSGPRTTSLMDAAFDNIAVNRSALP